MDMQCASKVLLIGILMSALVLASGIRRVEGSVGIVIELDGSVNPSWAPIDHVGETYTLNTDIIGSIEIRRDHITLDGAGYNVQGPDSIFINCQGAVRIRNFSLFGGDGYGIYVNGASDCVIENNNIKDCHFGIILNIGSNNNEIVANNISNCIYGIDYAGFGQSHRNRIFENTITYCDVYGICKPFNSTLFDNRVAHCSVDGIYGANYCSITNNSLFNNTLCIAVGNGNSLSKNNITSSFDGVMVGGIGNEIWANRIEDNEHVGIQIIMSNNNASGNLIAGNTIGVYIVQCEFINFVNNNVCSNAEKGISLHDSGNLTIIGNNVTNSHYGIYLSNSWNSLICHNRFIDNTVQVYSYISENFWDDGYLSGGNYWSHYSDVDEFSGPYQNETGADEIWDHPFVIDENNQDNYPIVPEFPPFLILPLFMIATLVAIIFYKKKHTCLKQ